ncbi:MAG TPA: hypothetical protein VFE58_10605 [Tepidisphaeraceae bacterium]|jgi:hypothetical protein|nr:hypothetical protein [Tepidisphaeraceae bacterium]
MTTYPQQYAVLHHTDIEEPHYDLLIEVDSTSDLWTWRCPNWPLNSGDQITRIKNHRRFYLTYDGPIPGNRGQVQKIDWGACTVTISPSMPAKIALILPATTYKLTEINPSQPQWEVTRIEETHV